MLTCEIGGAKVVCINFPGTTCPQPKILFLRDQYRPPEMDDLRGAHTSLAAQFLMPVGNCVRGVRGGRAELSALAGVLERLPPTPERWFDVAVSR